MFTLYGIRGSGSAAIEAALTLLGVPFRIVEAASWEPGPGLDELRKINPLAQIPTLVLTDGSVLTESAAILMHLGLVHPQSTLLPAAAAARAQALRGLVYIAANCYAAIGVIDYPERWCPNADAATLTALRAGARMRLHGCWDTFADQFLPAMAGAARRAGALDMLASVVSHWSGTRAHLATSRPALLAALLAVEAQPELQPVFHRHWPPTPA